MNRYNLRSTKLSKETEQNFIVDKSQKLTKKQVLQEDAMEGNLFNRAENDDEEVEQQGQQLITVEVFERTIARAISTAVQESLTAVLNQQRNRVADNHHNWGEEDKLIPDYDPKVNPQQTAAMWIRKVDEIAIANRWSDRVTISHALPKLKGPAKTWYEGLSTVTHTWVEWKALIEEWFPTVKGTQRLLKEMEQRVKQPGESVEEYFHDKMAKATLSGLSNTAMIDFLITGLRDEKLITALSTRDFNSPQELLKCIKQMEERLTIIGASKNSYQESFKKNKNWTSNQSNSSPSLNKDANDDKSLRSNRSKPKFNSKGEPLCFNCFEYGHMGKNCPKAPTKPKCTKCQKIGHVSTNCKVTDIKTLEVKHVEVQQVGNQNNEKYFKDALIYGKPIKSYLDLGSKCVTIRKSNADELGILYEAAPKEATIFGYGAGSTKPIGIFNANLKVDQAQAEVRVLVVPDQMQEIPLLIGQPFTEQDHITIIRRKNTLRVFEEEPTLEEDECLSKMKVPSLPIPPVCLWAREAQVIPPNYIGFIDIYSQDKVARELFVDAQMRFIPGKEHCIPRIIIALDDDGHTVLPIINIANRNLEIKKGQKIVRAENCSKAVVGNEETVLHLEEKNLKPLPKEKIKIGPNVTENEKDTLYALLEEYRDCFAESLEELGRTEQASVTIDILNDEPITYRPYRLSYTEREKVRTKIAELLEAGIIVDSNSPYASPILIVKKKNGEERLCVDYRALNRITKRIAFPLPRIDDQIERLKGSCYFTILDMASGYYQIPVEKSSQDKTAFITPDGHYEFQVLPFGLTNGPAIFQRMMNAVLGPLRFTIAMAYMDDLLIPSPDVKQGLENLREIFKVLRKAKLTLNLKKCGFFLAQIDYLGFEISKGGIRPSQRKIDSVSEFPVPKNIHDVRKFLGLTSYFRRFIKGFAQIAKPLSQLLQKEVSFKWGQTENESFEKLKELLTERPVLGLFSFEADTEVHCDASQAGIAGVLLQRGNDGLMHPVYYASRKTTREESKYHSSELETLAMVWTLEKFRVYLIGKNFLVVTDCNSVRNTMSKRDLVPRIGRWYLKIQEFQFDIEHRAGTKMSHVDALSRAPHEMAIETDIVQGLEILSTEFTFEDWLITAQRQDERLQVLKEQLLKKDNLTKDDIQIQKDYELKKGRIFKKLLDDGNKVVKLLWVVPQRIRWKIIKKNHDDIGHFAVDKTYARVKENFWFPGMRKYIQRYIGSCVECLYHKHPGGRKPGELHSIDKVGLPMDTVHMDHLGPFIKSITGNTFLLVIVDAFTKFTILRAVRNAGAGPTIKVVKEFIGLFGAPRRIISDQGTAFTSMNFEKFCKDANIMHVKNATATPRGNGQVERFNKTITPAIASSCQRQDEKDWDERLSNVQWGVNNTVHSATRRTPFSLLLNFQSRNPNGDMITDAIRELFDTDLQQEREAALTRIQEDQAKQRIRYNAKRAKTPLFEPGDLVVVEREPVATGEPRKTNAKYRGPYIITKKLGFDRYQIEDLPENQRTKRFYRNVAPVDKLKKWSISDQHYDIESNSFDVDELETTVPHIATSVIPVKAATLPTADLSNNNIAISHPGSTVDATRVVPSDDEDIPAARRGGRQKTLPQYLKDYTF